MYTTIPASELEADEFFQMSDQTDAENAFALLLDELTENLLWDAEDWDFGVIVVEA